MTLELARRFVNGQWVYTAENENGGSQLVITSPLDLPGCVAWYDASQLVGLNDGDPVALWPDLSTSGFDATSDEEAEQPVYKTNVQNGLPVVRFTLSGPDTFSITDVDQGTQTFTIAGSHEAAFQPTNGFVVSGSTGNDGFYTVVSATETGGNTEIVTVQALPDATVDGSMTPIFPAPQYLDVPGAGAILQDKPGGTVGAVGISNGSVPQNSGALFWISDGGGNHISRLTTFLPISGSAEIGSGANDDTIDGNLILAPVFTNTPPQTVSDIFSGVVVAYDFAGQRSPAGVGMLSCAPAVQAVCADPDELTSGNTPDTPSDDVCLGSTTIAHHGIDGDIGEIAVYDRYLSRSEQAQLLAYLTAKWATF